MSYLHHIKEFMPVYNINDDLEIVGYTDLEFIDSLDDMKITSGYIFKMGGGTILWKGVKSTITASSTIQAVFIACYDATI